MDEEYNSFMTQVLPGGAIITIQGFEKPAESPSLYNLSTVFFHSLPYYAVGKPGALIFALLQLIYIDSEYNMLTKCGNVFPVCIKDKRKIPAQNQSAGSEDSLRNINIDVKFKQHLLSLL